MPGMTGAWTVIGFRVDGNTTRWMNEAIATYRGLTKAGFTSTIDATQVQYHLFEADQRRADQQHPDEHVNRQQLADPDDRHADRRQQHEQERAAHRREALVAARPTAEQPRRSRRLRTGLDVGGAARHNGWGRRAAFHCHGLSVRAAGKGLITAA